MAEDLSPGITFLCVCTLNCSKIVFIKMESRISMGISKVKVRSLSSVVLKLVWNTCTDRKELRVREEDTVKNILLYR